MAIKYIQKRLEKQLAKASDGQNANLHETIEACTAAIGQTCREKVMKVFNVSLHALNLIISSSKIDQDAQAIAKFREQLSEDEIITKLLLKSEESNTRLTNKIHETLLDLSYHQKIGEDLVCKEILNRIEQHYSTNGKTTTSVNQKGLLAQLALLFKMVNSFGIEVADDAQPDMNGLKAQLTVANVLKAALPSATHSNNDVKNAATKIVLDVQRLTGQVADSPHLTQYVSDKKAREALKEKVMQIESEAELNETNRRARRQNMSASKAGANDEALAQLLADGSHKEQPVDSTATLEVVSEVEMAEARQNFAKNKAIVMDKGQHKDWQQRELALSAMHECFEHVPCAILQENEEFLVTCTLILKNCLEENNIQIYLVGLQTVSVFFKKALGGFESVMESLPTLLKAIALRTTDTNTRVRKKSIDLINQVWDLNGSQGSSVQGIKPGSQKTMDEDSISFKIASVLCDSALQDKAIIGRISLFIKKAMMIESGDELTKNAFKMVIGRDYEELTEFACQWCMHKNTKVRQCALKLIVEICRLNYIDPRGPPFKQRIINFILGLRPSLRDPLVRKINEICRQASSCGNQESKLAAADAEQEEVSLEEPFININEMELNIATKGRAASMDVRRGREQGKQSMTNKTGGGAHATTASQNNLPQIASLGASALPGLAPTATGQGQMPTIVLPHSEPLSAAQKTQAGPFLDLFGEEIMTCFYSQTWSTRATAIQKIEEQLHNLDPRRRDAMYGEINRSNLPPQLTIKVFLQLINEEGFKDPNLKNYLSLLELVQKALPTYFRYLKPDQVKAELIPFIKSTIGKTSDLKAKVREASINFCLYLSHQSPIGPEVMINQVIEELKKALSPGGNEPNAQISQLKQQVNGSNTSTSSFGSSHLIASCLNLMNQFQLQTKMVETEETELFKRYTECINEALRHTNPTVRKQGVALFKTLYVDFGDLMLQKLVNQKPQLVQKLTAEAKQEAAAASTSDQPIEQQASATAKSSFGGLTAESHEDANKQRTMIQLSENFANSTQVKQLVDDRVGLLKELRMPNPKKRLKAIVEIKKIIQKKLATVSSTLVREMVEPMQVLLRELLKDESTEVYLEALNLLKFIVGSLASHLSALDLHLMMGQFISLTITNASSANMRIRVASDKVIIFFAKHANIGSLIVAKEVLKNVERTNRIIQLPPPASMSSEDVLVEKSQKKEILVRNFCILHMLIQQFSIVLCYQPDFVVKCLEHVAETMNMSLQEEEPAIKSICTQIIVTLYNSDAQLLEQGVNKLDFTKKTPIRKVMIEHENLTMKHKNLQVINNGVNGSLDASQPKLVANASGDGQGSPNQSLRDTQQSFTSFNRSNQGDLNMSPTSNAMRQLRSRGDFGKTDSGSISWNRQNSEIGHARRPSELDNGSTTSKSSMYRQDSMQNTGLSWVEKRRQMAEQQQLLPDINGHRRRAPPTTESYQSMGRMTGAAGFKRDNVSAKGVPDSAGMTGFSYKDSSNNGQNSHRGGIGTLAIKTQSSSLFGFNNQNNEDHYSGIGGIGNNSAMKHQNVSSPSKSSNEPANQQSQDNTPSDAVKNQNRPPVYVPTKREPRGMRNSMSNTAGSTRGDQNSAAGSTSGYQPKTSFSYVPSAEIAAQQQKQSSGLFGRQLTRGNSNTRYQQPIQMPASGNNQNNSLGQARGPTSQLSGATSATSIKENEQPMFISRPTLAANQPMTSTGPNQPIKIKPMMAVAPPVATFQTKTFDYKEQQPDKKNATMI